MLYSSKIYGSVLYNSITTTLRCSMTRLAIRKSGGASIISLPRTVLKIVGLDIGSELELTLEDNRIILTPVGKAFTLDELLAGSPKGKLTLSDEDKEWVEQKPRGKEL